MSKKRTVTFVISLFLVGFALIGLLRADFSERVFSGTTEPKQKNAEQGLLGQPAESIVDSVSDGAPGVVEQATQQGSDNQQYGHADHGLDTLLSNSWKSKRHWFDEPLLDAQQDFLQKDTPLQVNASCQSNMQVDPNLNFRENVLERYAEDVTKRDVSNTFFKSVAQFFQYDERFWQVTLIWDRDLPAIYRYEFFSSEKADFSNNVVAEQTVLNYPQHPDALASLAWLEAMTSEYAQRGATIGARIVEQRVIDAKGKSHEWVAQNGQLVSWNFNSGICVLDADGYVGRCVCDNAQS